MGVVIDIIGSFIVRAAIVGMILQLMITLSDALYRNTERQALNEEASNITQIISSDLKLAGYGSNTVKQFPIASASDMQFRTDLNNDGIAETVRYYLGSGSNNTTLYRTWAYPSFSQTLEVARDVSRFRVNYYTISGTPTNSTGISVIKSVLVTIEIDAKSKLVGTGDNSASIKINKVSFEQHFFPPNL